MYKNIPAKFTLKMLHCPFQKCTRAKYARNLAGMFLHNYVDENPFGDFKMSNPSSLTYCPRVTVPNCHVPCARQPDHMLPAVPNAYLFTPQGGALMHSNYVSVFHQFQVSTIFPVAYPTRFNPLYSKDYRVFLENAILPTVILPGSSAKSQF